MKEPKLFMRLQETEDFATADCGCILQRGDGFESEYLACSLHFNAAKMARLLLKIKDYYLIPDNWIDDVAKMIKKITKNKKEK